MGVVRLPSWLIALTMVSGACVAAAQVTKSAHGYLFRVKFVKGRQYNYSITSTVTGKGLAKPQVVTGPFKVLVGDTVEGKGQITVSFGPLSIGDQVVMQPERFQFLENTQGKQSDSKTAAQQMAVEFPEGPKKIGESWTSETSLQAMGSKSRAKTRYKFLGMTIVHGKPAAELAVTIASEGQATTSGQGKILILAEDGSMWSTETNLTMYAPTANSKTTKLNTAMKMTRH